MVASAAPTGFLVILALLGILGVPISVPPLPPDPIVQRALPDECLFAVHLSGHAKANADSKNQTEQLLANEEVQEFVEQLGTQIVKGIRQKAAGDPLGEMMASELPEIVRILATRPLALYVSRFQMLPESADIRAGLIVNADQDAKLLEEKLRKIQSTLLADGPPEMKSQTVEVAGVKFSQLPGPPDASPVLWGFHRSFLLVAVGKDAAKDLLGRLADKNRKLPAWYTDLQKRAASDRVCSITYANVAGILEAAAPAVADPRAKAVLTALGVDRLRTVSATRQMTATDMASRTWLSFDGEPTGIFALAGTRGLTAADLSIIPAEASMAKVLKLDPGETYKRVLDGIATIEPNARAEAEMQINQALAQFGVSLEKDILKPLGDTWSVFSTGGVGFGMPTGLAATVSLKDQEAFASTHAKLLEIARGAIAQASQGKVSIKESDYKGTTLYTIQGSGEAAIPLAPTWCLSNNRLIVTLFPQMTKTLLARKPTDPSLANVPEVKQQLSGDPIAAFSFQDTESMLGSTYALYQAFSPMIQGQLAGQGIDVELPTLPNQATVMPFATPQVSVLRRSSDGLHYDSRYTMPVMVGADPGTAGIGVALLLPAIQAAREAARRNASMNNMKQLLLSMHIYHDVHKSFPAAAITGKDGKPLLSWRVSILPYIEEQNLYEQFHLDEPWDSEHNKKLIPKMPQVFLGPNRINQGDFTTTYLVPTGKAGLFKEVGKKLTIAELRDGTSNTIALVEAAEAKAVPWTKPEDYVVDPKKPLEGLTGTRPGGFIAAFADGSVRFLSESLDKPVLQALFTPDGGEAVLAP